MSQRDGFTSGFLAGALFGALVGGIVGVLVTGQKDNEGQEQEQSFLNSSLSKARAIKGRRSQIKAEESIEAARHSLEDKIAQLNTAIDDVRQQLGTVNGNATEVNRERALDP
jgi:gas vesicle protein